MKKYFNKLALLLVAISTSPLMAFAQEELADAANEVAQGKDWAVLLTGAGVMAVAVVAGTVAQGKSLSVCLEYIGRNPETAGKMFTPMIIGLAMIESLVVLSFVIAILIVL